MKSPQDPPAETRRTARTDHRRTLVLPGRSDWNRAAAEQLYRASGCRAACWIGDGGPDSMESLAPARATGILGRELDFLVLDFNRRFDPDALGAASGTLRGDGLLLLLTPPLEDWPAQAQALIGDAAGGRFIRRLGNLISCSDAVRILRPQEALPALRVPPPHRPEPSADAAGECITRDQALAVEALQKVARGHRRRPLVLVADRGRGKSAALGIAAARLLRLGKHRILLTGPRLDAVRSALRQAARVLPRATQGTGHLDWDGARLEFVPPDALVRAPREADLLMVDEAAAIPPALLETLLHRHARIAFATTVHGYEGTGRGFAVRFRKTLDRITPHWRELRLQEPIRWAPDDPLEALTFEALLMDAEPAGEAQLNPADGGQAAVFRRLDRDILARDEALLRELFGLLVMAHYRTRPRDLWRLLDAPGIRLYCLSKGGHVAATAMTVDEGGLAADLAEQVFLGRRRIPGHLLPQSLSQHLGLEDACAARYRRVIRIAVHPVLQGRGLGRRMLAELAREGRADGLDLLGASFGADAGLLGFWRHCGFRAVRLGVSRETSSGAYSASLLMPLGAIGERLAEAARHRFALQFPVMLGDALRDLDPGLACDLLADLPPAPAPGLAELDRADLAALAYGHRDFETSPEPVRRLVLPMLTQDPADCPLNAGQKHLLAARVLQHRSWQECAALLGLSGRQAAQENLRGALRTLLKHLADPDMQRMILRHRS